MAIHTRVASKSNKHWPLFTTQDEWTMVKYVMEVLRLFQYWTLWMSKRYTVTLHHVIALHNDMFDHMDGMMRALAKKMTQWKEDLFLVVKLARQKQSRYYAEMTPTTGMLLISAHIYTTKYQEAFLKCVENQYTAKHRHVPVNKLETVPSSNLVPSAMAS